MPKTKRRLPPLNIFLIVSIIAMAIALGLIAGGIAHAVISADKTNFIRQDSRHCDRYRSGTGKRPPQR